MRHVVVIGGGASGLTAALFAKRAGAHVTVLERASECGKKILMSGGSRCNVLPAALQPNCADFFTSGNRSLLAAVFETFPLHEIRQWLTLPEKLGGLGLHLLLEEETQKFFPASNSAREVRDRLLHACERQGVIVRVRASVESVARCRHDRSWVCTLAGGQELTCDAAIIAAGGLSYPAVGTDGTGFRIAQTLGHDLKRAAPYPALVPLSGVHPGGTNSLAGVSVNIGSLRAVPPRIGIICHRNKRRFPLFPQRIFRPLRAQRFPLCHKPDDAAFELASELERMQRARLGCAFIGWWAK